MLLSVSLLVKLYFFLSLLRYEIKSHLRSGNRDGYALYSKRLEKGTFERPLGEKPELSAQELMLILAGIRLCSVERRKRYERPLQV